MNGKKTGMSCLGMVGGEGAEEVQFCLDIDIQIFTFFFIKEPPIWEALLLFI